ncbi:MAG: ribonuclease G [Pseudomonadota bacterium]|nr:ribonuclease G [Pseudomonadota bacterium]
MSVEILVNVTPRESRAVIVEQGLTQELHVERTNGRGLAGSIYQGRATRVLPGMQAAFVDIGLERAAFLHASDIAPGAGSDAPPADIQTLVREGDLLLVQVLKDPIGTKGARLSTYVSLPSRFLVYMPQGSGIGISGRIEHGEERARLRDAVASGAVGNGGWIVRTAAEGASDEALRADRMFLERLWEVIRERSAGAAAGTRVHEDLALPLRMLRDLMGEQVTRVLVDAPAAHAAMIAFTRTFMPVLAGRIELFEGGRPLFDLYGVEDEIERALNRKVPLKSGGYLMFDQTEALTTIDVNTGAFVGHRNLEDTIYRTNLEAAVAMARQLRLRNLGGIIIADFIDMQDPEHGRAVLRALEQALAGDHVRTQVSAVSALGLVEMTRKRTRDSLEHQLCRPCPNCDSRGFVKTAETVAYQIFREVLRQTQQFDSRELIVLAHQDVIELLLDEEAAALADLELATGRPIRLQAEARYAEEQFDVMLV